MASLFLCLGLNYGLHADFFFFFKSRQKKKDKITYATSQSLRKYSHKNISNLYAKPSIVKVKTT